MNKYSTRELSTCVLIEVISYTENMTSVAYYNFKEDVLKTYETAICYSTKKCLK